MHLNTVEALSEQQAVDPKSVSESLQKFNILFNDPRSPVYSALQTIAQYKGDKGVVSFNKLFRDLEDFFTNKIDIESLLKEQRQLEGLTLEVGKSQISLKNIQSYLLKEQQELNKEGTEAFGAWTEGKDRHLAESLETRIKQMYSEFT